MDKHRFWGVVGVGCLIAAAAASACGPTGSSQSESPGSQSQEVVQLPANGTVTTIAGTGTPGAADNAVAKNGTLNDPAGVAVAGDGSIFVADWANNTVRRISSSGALSTVAKGSPNLIRNPRGEAPGATQAVPVPQWTVTAGTWSLGSRSNGCVDPCSSPFDGSKWISGVKAGVPESSIAQVIDLSAYRTAIAASRIQGAFSASYRGGGGAAGARVKIEYLDTNGIVRTTFDSGLLPGNGTSNAWLTVSDQRAVSPLVFSARVTLVTSFPFDTGFDGLQLRLVDTTAGANDRLLSGPSAVAVSPTDGELWIGGNGLWHGSADGATLSKVVDGGGYVAPRRVSSIAALADGYVYAADPTSNVLHVRSATGVGYYVNLTPQTDQIVAVVGTVPIPTTHRVWVAFRNSTKVAQYECVKGNLAGFTVNCAVTGTIGGTRGFLDDMDGTAGGERLGYINGLALGAFGDLFITEESNHAVRRSLLPLTRTSAGTGVAGFVEGVSNVARFSSPSGVAVTPTGNVIVADRINNRIRSIGCGGINVCGTAVAGCTMTPKDDQNACTTDTCMVLAVKNDSVANGTACTDNNACTVPSDACNAGICVPGAPKVTTDNNACTVDSCNAATGAVSNISVAISDGNACTTDACDTSTGVVSHVAIPINDNDVCTTDSCNTATGVVSHVANPIVEDANPCTTGTCDPITGVTSHPPSPEGTVCGTNRLCNSQAQCEAAAPPVTAPILDASAGTPFGASTGFIYEGTNKVQTGVTASYVDKAHAGWLVGYVKTAAGNPMSNVVVKVADNSNYGETLTRSDGRFDLIVNGGATYTLRFTKAGHFGVDRRIYVGWEQTAALEDVVLLTPDPKATSVTPNLGTQQVAIGSTTTGIGDDLGTRTPMVVIPKSTKVFVDGTERTAAMTLRLTEYTTGPDGAKRMPAPLPPATGYTYAVEISADEALTANRIDFKDATTGQVKDVFFYLEDFIGFAATMPACITGCQGVATCVDACRSVPSGYYDRSKFAWIGSKSGRLIKVISVTSGVAAVDVTGDSVVDSVLADTQLISSLGFTSDELTALGGRYSAGAALWRVPISHMTPYDCNWPIIPPPCDPNGICPEPPPAPPPPPPPPCGGAGGDNSTPGSIIGCDSMSLGEKTDVPGTTYSLHYSTRRMPGYAENRQRVVALTGPQVHSQAAIITVQVAVAGRRYEKVFTPVAPATTFAPNLSWPFDLWDGLDAAGRAVVGFSNASIKVTTYYRGGYAPSSFFGAFPTPSTALTVAPRAFYPQSITINAPLMGRVPDQAWSLGGWTFDQHHFYDAPTNTLLLGSGGIRPSAAAVPTITRLLTGLSTGAGGEGAVAVAPNGDIFVADYGNHTVRRIRGGVATTVIGATGTSSCSSGQAAGLVDGVSGTAARLSYPMGLAVGPDGSVYITGRESTVRKATPNPGSDTYSVMTVAGVACQPASSTGHGDNGGATLAKLHSPVAVAVGPDRSIYIAEAHRVRRVDASGNISTVAGTGTGGLSGGDRVNEGELASTVPVGGIDSAIAVNADGTLFIAAGYALTSVDRNGRLHYLNKRFDNQQPVGDGVPLKDESIGLNLSSLAIRPDGSIVFNDEDWQRTLPVGTPHRKWLRSVNPAGTVTTLAASGPPDSDSSPPLKGVAIGNGPDWTAALAAVPDGSIVAVSRGNVYQIEKPKARAVGCNDSSAQYQVAAGDEDYCFESSGRHLKTIDSRTGQTRLTFEYTDNVLSGIIDRGGLKTNLKKLSSPSRYEIVAPFLQKTTIGLDSSSGYATSIGDTLGGITLAPMANGLLDNLRDRNLQLFDFTFDSASGLLTGDASPLGSQTLARILLSNGRLVTHKTPGLRETKYETILDVAGVVKHTTTFPDLTTVLKQGFPSGIQTVKDRDGTVTETTVALDPTFATSALVSTRTKVTLPSGLVKTTQEERDVPVAITGGKSQETRTRYGAAADAPFTKTTRQYTTDANDLPGIGAAQQIVIQSPEGRKTTRLLDTAGRTASSQIGSLTPTLYTYDTSAGHQGQLQFVKRGVTRTTELNYRSTPNADAGFVERITDAAGIKTDFTRDIFGRPRTVVEAKGVAGQEATTKFDWDGNGNLSLVTPPGKLDHRQLYDVFNGLKQYTPPTVAGVTTPQTAFTTTPDRTPDSETRADGAKITYAYVTTPQNTGQLDTVTFPGAGAPVGTPTGTVDYDYYLNTETSVASGQAPGKVKSIKGPYGSTLLQFEYDGRLTKKWKWSNVNASTEGAASVAWTYDANLLPVSEAVTPISGAALTRYLAYDNDQLLTCNRATSGTCVSLVAGDYQLLRSAEHASVIDLKFGYTPTTTAVLTEHWDYSDSAVDGTGQGAVDTDVSNSRAFGELRRQILKSNTSTTLAELTYDAPPTDARDLLGRIVTKTENFSVGGVSSSVDIGYEYDERGRLRNVTANDLPQESFDYDSNGNRTAFTPAMGAGRIGKYDDQDRLLYYGSAAGWDSVNGRVSSTPQVGDIQYTYGANGELAQRSVRSASGNDVWKYTYDVLGNLITVIKPGVSANTIYTYLVDGKGRRIGKRAKVGAGADALTKRWLYRDQLSPVAELDANGKVTAQFVYGSRGNIPDLVIKVDPVTGAKTTYRLFSDQLGSPRLAVNVDNVSDVPYRVDYSAFGKPAWKAAVAENFNWLPFGFAGGIYDKDTQLVRFGARDYDAEIGRWVSKDPIRFDGEQANLYVYVGNDPVNHQDSTGLAMNECREALVQAFFACAAAAAGGGVPGGAACGYAAASASDTCGWYPEDPPTPPRCNPSVECCDLSSGGPAN